MDKQEPAFPIHFDHGAAGVECSSGMTLRDYFAGKAMQALLSDPNVMMDNKKISDWAYSMANAMMEARKNG